MKRYNTKIRAIDPNTGLICNWSGPIIEAESFEGAVKFCQENGLGYCTVDGELFFVCGKWLGSNPELAWDFLNDAKMN